MALYKDGNPVSGLNSIPRLTLAQYNALNVKPEFWVRTDAPESYKKLSADQVSYDSDNTVKDKIDNKVISYVDVTATTDNYGHIQLSPQYVQNADVYKVTNVYALANNLYCVLYPYISTGGTPLIYVEVRDLATNARQPNLSVTLRICGLFD